MSERDSETFERFARRFAGIEADVKNPPPFGRARNSATNNLGPRRSISPAIVVLALAVAVVTLASLIAGGRITPPTPRPPAAAGSSSAPPLFTPSPALTQAALVPLDPTSPPQQLTGPCANYSTIVDRLITTIEQDARASSAVVVGTVVGIGKAQWNTPDGRPPQRPDVDASRVLRLLRIEVETVVKGTAPAVATIWIPGGMIGCDRFHMGGFPSVVDVGSRYVFFLSDIAPRLKLEGSMGVRKMWSVEGDLVATDVEGRVTLAVLIARASGSH